MTTVDSLLMETLAVITRESPEFDESFGMADRLLALIGETPDLAARVYAAIPADYPWRPIADLLGIFIWSTSDNGTAITSTTEEWLLDGSDPRRVLIALHLDVYPFRSAAKMVEVLSRIALTMPEAAAECRRLIATRRGIE